MINKSYNRINNILGWLVCILASTVYIITTEPTASWWDCGEYIATAFKLQVGHPPGAPTFQLIGRIFSMFASDVTQVAHCINVMSALCSGFTILFLFWSLTKLAKKIALKTGELTTSKTIAVFGSALVGSLAYTFSDTFWFSAVEGEVYAMSSFFTALVFWCILKWDEEYDENRSDVNPYRWIVLIAYLVGLSIGVHLLNLLTLPAVAMIVYFKLSSKANVWGVLQTVAFAFLGLSIIIPAPISLLTLLMAVVLFVICYKKGSFSNRANWGILWTLIGAFALLAIILYGIIPGVVSWAGKIEVFFINSIGLPFNTGTILFFTLVIGLIIWGLYYFSKRKKNNLVYASILSFMFLLIGYMTFFILIIRSNANPPIDENNPEDAVSLLAYLNREQYGSNPLIYGQLYNSRQDRNWKDGSPVYVRDTITKTYRVSDDRKGTIPTYRDEDCMFFPRMWDAGHETEYKEWIGKRQNDKTLPTYQENLQFFEKYQMGYMYWRYFMWNFAGRQNDVQGRGPATTGSWISGVNMVDKYRTGDTQEMPESYQNKGENKYYFLPLILGLIGLIFYGLRDSKNAFAVFLLFFMTGIAIGIYLNMYAYQPRERDYAFAASFYGFAFYIGIGVYALYAIFEKLKKQKIMIPAACGVTLICLLAVPVLMAKENWDDHDRSHRYTTLAMAKNYLDSCEPNAILFTLGDNDTFPLWYAQEVEGYRTDVRVCNLSLFSTDWYIDQMRRKAYQSEALPITMTWEEYKSGTRDVVILEKGENQYVDLKTVVEAILNPEYNHSRTVFFTDSKRGWPSNKVIPGSFSLPVDKEKVRHNGTVPEDVPDSLIVDKICWNLRGDNINQVMKAYIGMMDILAHNNWERPVYFASTTGAEAYFGLEEYFQLEGMAYRLVPIKTPYRGYYDVGRVNEDKLYKNLMHTYNYHNRLNQYDTVTTYPYLWGGINDPRVYNNEDNMRMVNYIRSMYSRLAEHLISEGKMAKAEAVLDQCFKVLPDEVVSMKSGYQLNTLLYTTTNISSYYKIGTPNAIAKADKLVLRLGDYMGQEFKWWNIQPSKIMEVYKDDAMISISRYNELLTSIDSASHIREQMVQKIPQIDELLTYYVNTIEANQVKFIKGGWDKNQNAIVRAFVDLKEIEIFSTITKNKIGASMAKKATENNLEIIRQMSPELESSIRNYLSI